MVVQLLTLGNMSGTVLYRFLPVASLSVVPCFTPCGTGTNTDGSLRSLADSRKLNQLIRRMPYPLPKIQDLLQQLEGF